MDIFLGASACRMEATGLKGRNFLADEWSTGYFGEPETRKG